MSADDGQRFDKTCNRGGACHYIFETPLGLAERLLILACERRIYNSKLSRYHKPLWLSGYIAAFSLREVMGSILGIIILLLLLIKQ